MKVSLIIFLIGFMTIAPSIYIGIKYFDGKVVEQPYESGLKYDEDKKLIAENGLDLDVLSCVTTDNMVSLQFMLDKNSGADFTDPEFYITRPASDHEIQKLNTKMADEGVYETVVTLNTKGYHILKAKGKLNGQEVSLQKSFYIN
ncbi:MAG: FixH family protein [Deferribacterales bacterium]|jgi:nitrogen fixation protein FixH